MSAATFVASHLLRVLPRARIGQALGGLADRPWSPAVGEAVVRLYARAYGVSLDEAELGPDGRSSWPSFDAFFTRRLRRGARPIDGDPDAIVSPADGRLESMARIGDGCLFTVKGRPYSVGELLGADADAERFVGGAGFVVYLSPKDYHRVHAPVAGHLRRIRSVAGDYFPVNSIGMRHVANLFCRNRRVVLEIETEARGRVAVIMVAAMVVGRITTVGVAAPDVPFGEHRFDPPLRIDRGDELGVFHLGSTAVVLIDAAGAGEFRVEEGPVRYGQALLRAPPVGRAFDAPRPGDRSAERAWSLDGRLPGT